MNEASDQFVQALTLVVLDKPKPHKRVTHITVKQDDTVTQYVYIPELDLLTEKPF